MKNIEAPNLKIIPSIYKGFRGCLEKVRKTGDSELLKRLSIERVFALASSKDEIDDSIKNVRKKLEQQSVEILKALSMIQNTYGAIKPTS